MFPIVYKAQGIMPYDDSTGCMISINNEQVIEFQKKLRSLIPSKFPFVEPEGEEREQNFEPHLTLADMILAGTLQEVIATYDLENLILDVQVNCILCSLPKDFSVEESLKESNYHVVLPVI